MTRLQKFSFQPFGAGSGEASSATYVFFIGEGLRLGAYAAKLAVLEQTLIDRAAADDGFRGKVGEHLTLFAGGRRVVLVGIGNPDDVNRAASINLGGRAARAAGYTARVVITFDLPEGFDLPPEAAAELALGFRLRSYRFDTYRTRITEPQLPDERSVTILTRKPELAEAAFAREMAVAEGVELARSLVNEPPNVLTPPEFARRVAALQESGLHVEILREADLERLGFRALLAVGRGSAEESHVAVLRWNGGADPHAPPLAFIGKGVCFDAGGISLKPALNLADLKSDMAGAACVTGLMLALARSKAPVNAIGAIGLVENMPDGKALRPGDIVRSLSGQTIEVADTDYEGRLVLADLLWYVQATYKPRFMIDLATLTDAIVTGIGREYAGLFSNNDDLAARLAEASIATGELVWRMPMGPNFDKEMDSKIADVRNIDSKFGGASTAANFIQRFVNKTPWAHIDIAGPAQDMPETDINTSWGTGWGVRLLDRLVRAIETDLK